MPRRNPQKKKLKMARYLAGRAKKDRVRTKARTDYTAPDPMAPMGRKSQT